MISKEEMLEWTEEGLVEFRKLKEMPTPPQELVYLDYEKQFFVECDISNFMIGEVLSQRGDHGTLRPIY